MSPLLVALSYAAAIAFSLSLLWRFGASHWYWHLLSLVAAVAIGVTPLPPRFNDPAMTVLVGVVFLFLFFWAVGGPVVALKRHPPKWLHHH